MEIDIYSSSFGKILVIAVPYCGEILANTYQIVDEIGKGGMGIVYLAMHLNLQKYVVVKKIKDNYIGIFSVRGEADILKSLHHTNLPQVYDFIQIGNEIYTVMDYIEGYDLKYYIDNGYTFPEEILWNWLEQLLQVLRYLHNHGILHLDVKPANIMVTPENRIVLIDFNVSLSDDSYDMKGISRIYSSPEQYLKWEGILYKNNNQDIKLDSRTDLYSLAACFYHMMTGYQPSPVKGDMISLQSFELEYDKSLIKLISRMLEHNRNRRFESAQKILKMIERIQRSKAEKYTLRMVFGIMSAAVLVLLIAFIFIIYRDMFDNKNVKIENIKKNEEVLVEYNNNGEYENAYNCGINFLIEYKDDIDDIEGSRKSILNQIVDSCIGMEDYKQAKKYIEELLEISQSAELYHKASIIYAHNNDFDRAEKYIEYAKNLESNDELIKKSEAELCAAKGDYNKAIAIYEDIYDRNPTASNLRKIASLNIHAGTRKDITELESNKYMTVAIEKYEKLIAEGNTTYADEMNLSIAYEKCNMNEKTISLLEKMAVEYPNQYEIFLRLGIIQYDFQIKKPAFERDYQKVKQNIQKAKSIYDNKKYKRDDDLLENMVDVINSLP